MWQRRGIDNIIRVCKNTSSLPVATNKEDYVTTDELGSINNRISDLTQQKNDLLRELRRKCNHLRLVELDAYPPMRICADCGAEERGWYCGYHVLVMVGDTWNVPHKKERVLVKRTVDSAEFYRYRKDGPLYPVGQSHPNFPGGGVRSYEQLIEIV